MKCRGYNRGDRQPPQRGSAQKQDLREAVPEGEGTPPPSPASTTVTQKERSQVHQAKGRCRLKEAHPRQQQEVSIGGSPGGGHKRLPAGVRRAAIRVPSGTTRDQARQAVQKPRALGRGPREYRKVPSLQSGVRSKSKTHPGRKRRRRAPRPTHRGALGATRDNRVAKGGAKISGIGRRRARP